MLEFRPVGEVAEWSIVPDSKSGVLQGTVGSNPPLSAKYQAMTPLMWRFCFVPTISTLIKGALGCHKEVRIIRGLLFLDVYRGGFRKDNI